MEEQQELAQVFGQEAFRAVGDIANLFTKPYEQAKADEAIARDYLALKAKEDLTEAERARLAVYEQGWQFTPESAEQLAQDAVRRQALTQADYDAWKEGSLNKTLLHAFVGALQANLGGADTLSGALGAGAAEASRSLTADLPKELQQWASAAVGAAAGAMAGGGSAGLQTGAATAWSGEVYNRQLHPKEIERIKAISREFARLWNIEDEAEAEARLTRQALRQVDESWALLLPGDDEAARTFLLSNSGSVFGESGFTYFRAKMLAEYQDATKFSQTLGTHYDLYAGAVNVGASSAQVAAWNQQEHERASALLGAAALAAGPAVISAVRSLVVSGTALVRGCLANLVFCVNEAGLVGAEFAAGEAMPAGAGVAVIGAGAKLTTYPFSRLGTPETSPWLNDPRSGVRVAIEAFRDGGSFLVPKSTFEKYFGDQELIGRIDGQFMTTKASMDRLLAETNGDMSLIKQRLGVPTEYWNEPMLRVDVLNPLLHNARLPSGLNSGANSQFKWGGYTSRGLPELITNPVPKVDIRVTDIPLRESR